MASGKKANADEAFSLQAKARAPRRVAPLLELLKTHLVLLPAAMPVKTSFETWGGDIITTHVSDVPSTQDGFAQPEIRITINGTRAEAEERAAFAASGAAKLRAAVGLKSEPVGAIAEGEVVDVALGTKDDAACPGHVRALVVTGGGVRGAPGAAAAAADGGGGSGGADGGGGAAAAAANVNLNRLDLDHDAEAPRAGAVGGGGGGRGRAG